MDQVLTSAIFKKDDHMSVKIGLLQLLIFSLSWGATPEAPIESSDTRSENYEGNNIYRSFNGTDYLYSTINQAESNLI